MKVDIRKATIVIRDKDGNLLELLPDGSIQITPKSLKCRMLSQPDLEKNFSWSEVDGVYVVTQIIFESQSLNTELGYDVQLHRVFTYQVVDPYNLETVSESLVLV